MEKVWHTVKSWNHCGFMTSWDYDSPIDARYKFAKCIEDDCRIAKLYSGPSNNCRKIAEYRKYYETT